MLVGSLEAGLGQVEVVDVREDRLAYRLLLDGGFNSVVIEAVEPTLSVLIPQNALQRDQRGDFVLVVTDNQLVEQRYVVLGPQEGTAIVVEEGLREGESVIVDGLQRARPGIEVNAVLAGASGED